MAVIYIDPTLPGTTEQRRQLLPLEQLSRQAPTSTKIFCRSHVQKYEDRSFSCRDLTMIEYLTRYKVVLSDQDADDDEQNVYSGQFANVEDTTDYNHTTYVPELQQRVPTFVRDKKNYIFKVRGTIPLWRTFSCNVQQHGEQFYFQQIVLHHVSSDFEVEKVNFGTWKNMFYALLRENRQFNAKFDESFLLNLRQQEQAMEEEISLDEEEDFNLQRQLICATEEQRYIYEQIIQHPVGIHLIHGSVGVGKSHLLKLLNAGLKSLNFVPYRLAPAGIAATTINGQTSRPDIPSPTRVDEYFQKLGDDHSMALLIGEVSMVPSSILDTLHETMVKITENQEPNGGILTIFFDDFAQLGVRRLDQQQSGNEYLDKLTINKAVMNTSISHFHILTFTWTTRNSTLGSI